MLIAHIPNQEENLHETLDYLLTLQPRAIIAPVSRSHKPWFNNYESVITVPQKGFRPDNDGIVRKLKIPSPIIDAISVPKLEQETLGVNLINFRGKQNTFPAIYFFEIHSKKMLPSLIKDKIILLHIEDDELEPLKTPAGPLNTAEVLANMIDNALLRRWITPLPYWITMILSLLITILMACTVIYLQANLAFLGGLLILAGSFSLSFLIFDLHYLWAPISAFATQIIISYLIFINYKLNKKEQLAWALEKENAYNEEMSELKKNFLNLFSHDLKTPIAKILAQVDILDGQMKNNSALHEGFSKIRKYSYDLNSHVKNILKISQIESDRFTIKKDPCDINEIIQQVITSVSPLAIEKSIQIDTKLEPLFSINCDSELIQQIILNLVENAIKYSPRDTNICVTTSEDDTYVTITVIDQGDGIKEEEQELIWQKFSRLSERTEGTGLGLYLVKYFVEAHDGMVFIESKEKQGSMIGFKLPVN